MVMSLIWCAMVLVSVVCALAANLGPELCASVFQGAQAGITLAISMAGGICLWMGLAAVMERIGITQAMARATGPLLHRMFPSSRHDRELAGALSANICANFLGLGNAATPMGICAARRMARGQHTASDELCRLIVLNTASIQLIPANVAAIRASLGCAQPFDILPAVWITSLASAGLGLCAAWGLGKVWRHD